MLIIGSHVSFGSGQLLGSAKEAVSYGANAFMFYTGAPQNTMRKPIDVSKTSDAHEFMKSANIDLKNVICHAPYIVNLANNKDIEKYKFSINFLTEELKRCQSLGVKTIVLHPGSSVGLDRSYAIKNIIYGLNLILASNDDVTICLETMAGKGTEIGSSMEEISEIIEGVIKKEQIGVCLDTCHLSDSGVDMSKFEDYLDLFDQKIGLSKIKVVHVNDSKNPIGSHKDRHENIGFGNIGFESLLGVLYNKRLEGTPKILETPYITDSSLKKDCPPYKFEIEMIKTCKFDPNLIERIVSYYE